MYINGNKILLSRVALVKREEWSEFWDVYQHKGAAFSYSHRFSGDSWTDRNFKPKYNIRVENSSESMFNSAFITDLTALLEKQGVTLDFSQCSVMSNTFAWSTITRIPTITFTTGDRLLQTFDYACSLVTIEKIVLKDDGSQKFINAFRGAESLANITFEGVIGTDINFQNSPLTAESAKSVLLALKNYSGTDSAFTYSVSFGASVWELLDAEGETSPTGKNWVDYTTDKGWNT